jgi:glycopeptide antibiotics resistance protein
MLLTFEEIALPVGLSALAVLLAILRHRQRSWPYCFASVLFWIYILALAGLTLFPIPIGTAEESPRTAASILARVNLIPFDFGGLFDLHPNVIRYELGGNILLTVPFGLGLPFLFRMRARLIPWLAVMVGMAIETAQLLVSIAIGGAYRSVDINDVLLNAIGVLIGYGLFRASTWLYLVKKAH